MGAGWGASPQRSSGPGTWTSRSGPPGSQTFSERHPSLLPGSYSAGTQVRVAGTPHALHNTFTYDPSASS